MSQQYEVIRRRGPLVSTSNQGSPYYQIDLKGLEDGLTYTTYVDSSMENFHQWRDVIESRNQMVLSGLRMKSKDKRLINADSTPKIHSVVKAEPKTPPSSNLFNNLFE